jgi:hypothetical protein
MEPWRTAIANSDEANIWIRGYDIGSLMQRPRSPTCCSFSTGPGSGAR